MKPIPLTTPDGTVAAWMCGLCHHVRAGMSKMYRLAAPCPELAESSKRDAERCCTCMSCGKELPEDLSVECEFCAKLSELRSEKIRAEWAVKDAQRAKTFEPSDDQYAVKLLNRLMRDISEDYYCAGWMGGLEFTLWAMVLGGPTEFGMGEVPAHDVETLRRLSEDAGGWVAWDDVLGGEVFVPMVEWQVRYERHAMPRL